MAVNLFISYRPSFFPIDLLPKHINHKSTGEKTRIHNLPYRPCNEVKGRNSLGNKSQNIFGNKQL